MEFNVHRVIHQMLADDRLIFFSENDFVFAFATALVKIYRDAHVYAEYPFKYDDKDAKLDLLVVYDGREFPFEFKYAQDHKSLVHNGVVYKQNKQGAVPNKSYDYIKDIKRLETFMREPGTAKGMGFAIMLSSDPDFWKPAGNSADYSEFLLHDRTISTGKLKWGSIRDNKPDIELLGVPYTLKWEPYSIIDKVETKILITEVK